MAETEAEGAHGGPRAGMRTSRATQAAADQRDEGTCAYCGEETTQNPGPRQKNYDHVYPRSRGGDDSPDNVVVSCRTCNLQKGARTPSEWNAAKLRAGRL